MGTTSQKATYANIPPADEEELILDDEGGFRDEPDDEPSPPPRRRKIRVRKTEGFNIIRLWGLVCAVSMIVAGLLSVSLLSRDHHLAFMPRSHVNSTNGNRTQGDDDDFVFDFDDNEKKGAKIHWMGKASIKEYNPFQVKENPSWYGSVAHPPPYPSRDTGAVGYFRHPSIHADQLLFISEGDLYLTNIEGLSPSETPVGMKLTSTVGNVVGAAMNPKYPYLIAYTATYSARREVYLLDLRPAYRGPALRLTYMPTEHGVRELIGWSDDGSRIVFSAMNEGVGMPDTRLYELQIQHEEQDIKSQFGKPAATALGIHEIPLAQATDGFVHEESKCIYFVRYKQSSNTVRYVGGTAENLWVYCPEMSAAVPLTSDYKGTSKSPRLLSHGGDEYLLFLSDRSATEDGSSWIPNTMELWAMPLPQQSDLYSLNDKTPLDTLNLVKPVKLTQMACDNDGMALKEFAVDAAKNTIILRVGSGFQIVEGPVVSGLMGSLLLHRRRLEDGQLSSTHLMAVDLPILVYSDFNQHHERVRPVKLPSDLVFADVYSTAYKETSVLVGLRGQAYVVPVVDDTSSRMLYEGSSSPMPQRRYRVAPGATTGGLVRILAGLHVPLHEETGERRALLLATDPLSETAEHAFYLVDTQASSNPSFLNVDSLPTPFIGGHINGGSTKDGGLGSVLADSLQVSPCGRRATWTDTDGRICVMSLNVTTGNPRYTVLPTENENGEAMIGDGAVLSWSPAGRYLAIEHQAKNQFSVISIADLGDPVEGSFKKDGRIVQATPSRFNSGDVVWGRMDIDALVDAKGAKEGVTVEGGATTLFFRSDRDIVTDVASPWGTRAPQPHLPKNYGVYALPLLSDEDYAKFNSKKTMYKGINPIMELLSDQLVEESQGSHNPTAAPTLPPTGLPESVPDIPPDYEISFGPEGDSELAFARRAFRLAHIPEAPYVKLVSQCTDDRSLVLVEQVEGKGLSLKVFKSDTKEAVSGDAPGGKLVTILVSTQRDTLVAVYTSSVKIIPNTMTGLKMASLDMKLSQNIADVSGMALSIWPSLEYQQMYSDAWRMLRDYFYDPDMTGIDWPKMHKRYLSLVQRCAKREELDDVLEQLAAELSALHVFVYGGEYPDPSHGDDIWVALNDIGTLGATLVRSVEWNGYVVQAIHERDPDFNMLDGRAMYSPLSDRALSITGQKGLEVGDVIVGVNGESVMSVPNIHMLLRGTTGDSIRLEVLRTSATTTQDGSTSDGSNARHLAFTPEPIITVPISPKKASKLRYAAWEWKTRQAAKDLASKLGFSLGYIHLQDMSGAPSYDSFARSYFPEFNKEGLIIDVRHNNGGNIDSWLLEVLQRQAWTYWQGRATNITNGGLGWDEMFAFRGRVVVLLDEKTASDGEGFSRGFKTLNLGKLVGKRSWGGGIWLSSDNTLVDGGIATAPEIGTYNDEWGWGMGIEQMGVEPDVSVDNDPHMTYQGKDSQLEKAIDVLHEMILNDPVTLPNKPGKKRDMSLPGVLQCETP